MKPASQPEQAGCGNKPKSIVLHMLLRRFPHNVNDTRALIDLCLLVMSHLGLILDPWQAPTCFRTNLPCRASNLWFVLARHNFWLAEISYNIYARMSSIISHGFNDYKNHSLLNSVALLAYFWVFVPFFYVKKRVVLRKSASPFGQVQTKMYLPESPFFKNSLARASGLVLMSNPARQSQTFTIAHMIWKLVSCYIWYPFFYSLKIFFLGVY